MPENMFKDRAVFVSGGTGYLGQAICRAFSGYGARVFFTYHRNGEKAAELQAELPASRAIPLDLRDSAGIEAVSRAIHAEVEAVDVLVNNAGTSQVMPFSMIEAEDLDLLLDINVKGTFFLTKALVRRMIRRRAGAVVNLGSLAGHRMLDVPVHYALSKAAVAGFTTALAVELKRYGIRVNAVSPGMLEDGVAKGIPDPMVQDYLKHCSSGRPGRAEEVAELVCFLASPKASYINGQNFFIDGGI